MKLGLKFMLAVGLLLIVVLGGTAWVLIHHQQWELDAVTVPVHGLRARQAATVRTVLAFIGGLAAVLLGMIFALFERLVYRRVRRAADVMSRVAADPTILMHLPDGSRDEIGILGSAFNRMSDSLRDAYNTLEERVRDRTAALAAANHALEKDIMERKRVEQELLQAKEAAEEALGRVKQLQGLLPICCYCKKIRDDHNYWQQLESYFTTHADARFSHGICPDCYEAVVKPELARQCELCS